MQPGATYFFMPIVNDWTKFDVSTQNLIMSAKVTSATAGKRTTSASRRRDGNDIETDVTVRWRIDPSKAPQIWQLSAPSTKSLEERLVRPQARAYVRDVLNRLDSEEYYNPDLRFRAANDATRLLAAHLAALRHHRRAGHPRRFLVQARLPDAHQPAQRGGEAGREARGPDPGHAGGEPGQPADRRSPS